MRADIHRSGGGITVRWLVVISDVASRHPCADFSHAEKAPFLRIGRRRPATTPQVASRAAEQICIPSVSSGLFDASGEVIVDDLTGDRL